ncbi:MAG TPA: putative Ig domain-containing protein, partial [Leptospiraceae bacterium]|nr:putative Ig domain-containing protein [Leptospiraceae bacterium]
VAAGKTKKSSKISSDDVEKYVAALTEDIADGTADGTNSKGEALSVNGTAVGSTPLTGTLMGALAEYVSSKPSLGITTAEAAAVTFNQAPVFLQFLPVESSSNIGLAYSNTFYSLFWIGMPASITPAVKGTISSCTASPPLPAGLSISSTACVISGIPTVISAPTNYTITAANAEERTAASLTLSADVYRQWSEVQTNLNSESVKGLSGSETTNAFGSLAGTGKWVGGVLAPDGKIYGIPFDSTSVMELDPAANTAGTFGSLAGTAKWTGGVLAPNGKIYGIPTDSTTVLVIDPVTKTTATFGSLAGTAKWAGGVLAPNGKIYGIPQNSTSVLVIDPAANTASTFGSLAGTNKWMGGVLAPNGKIYGIPFDSTTVLVIDPAANTASTLGSLAGTGKWMEGVLAPNGKIYGIPAGATDVLVIDPASDTASTFGSVGVGTYKWTGGLLAPNGKIYGIPRYASNVLVIDPNTNTTASFASLSGSPNKWSSGMIGANGKIYGIPFYDTTVLEIDPKSVGIWPSDLYLSPYFNRY